ncbi:MAG: uroporphyrinogen-III C-methyltransferase [Gammaproteobacteria bacterium]|jgi:uroporphyrin-III C-methyltransferase / precorrin-2 dehydrogenase / sirohydrochlorin ferrochelatase|nr:uroporphyrinogen-III C-methyltransferase [Gammaproteobacteria bacterium]
MDYLPIFIDLRGRDCLVVGGGEVAARKVQMLLRVGARIEVVAPQLGATIERLYQQGEVEWRAEIYQDRQLERQVLVYAATNQQEVNRQVAERAKVMNIPVNVVDTPALCSFITPSIIDRSPVVAAISTGGASPVLARLIRARLESMIPAAYGHFATLAARFRERVKEKIEPQYRRLFWEKAFQGPIAEMIFSGRQQEAEQAMDEMVTHCCRAEGGEQLDQGEVYLIGGGPGDPDLLTFRALRLMQQADVIVYDRLISPAVLDLTRRDAERIYVGKERDNHSVPQDQINQLLVDLAQQGKRVARLKGGDPFIFGRGGEEIELLAEKQVPFQVVPGITAASGISAYAGIPLTHRDHAQSVTFATGHLKDGSSDLNWEALAHPGQTVVFYMGLKGIDTITNKLIEHGMEPATPAALVQKGTTPDQEEYIGTLESLPQIVADSDIKPPTLIIIGSVVTLHDQLDWFQPDEQRSIAPRVF